MNNENTMKMRETLLNALFPGGYGSGMCDNGEEWHAGFFLGDANIPIGVCFYEDNTVLIHLLCPNEHEFGLLELKGYVIGVLSLKTPELEYYKDLDGGYIEFYILADDVIKKGE